MFVQIVSDGNVVVSVPVAEASGAIQEATLQVVQQEMKAMEVRFSHLKKVRQQLTGTSDEPVAEGPAPA